MDTPFPTLSAETFDALVAQQTQGIAAPIPTLNILSPSDVPEIGSTGLPNNLRQALAWSLELAPQVMTNLVSRALQSMDRSVVSLMGTAQARALEDAAAAMEAQRAAWARQFTALLRMALAYPAPAKMAAILPKVDLRICAAEAAQLDTLVQSGGSRRANPLAPQAYVQALLELIARSPASPDQRKIWADYLLAALSSQLAWVYLQLQAVVREPSSREASAVGLADGFEAYAAVAYGFAPADAAAQADTDADADGQAGSMNTQTQQLAEQARRTVQRLRQHLGLPDEADESGAALAQALNGNPMDVLLHDLDVAEQLMAQIRERGLPMPSLDDDYDEQPPSEPLAEPPVAPPSPQVTQVTQGQVAELVRRYQNTTSPSLQRVPVPLREAMEELLVPLFILTQKEPHLLEDEAHPAQQFLSLLTQRSLRYSSEIAEGFAAFMSMIDKLIDAIAAMRQPNALAYEKACASLQSLWQRQDEAAAQAAMRLAQEQEQLAQAKLLAGRLGFQLVGRRDAGDAPPMIKQFLMGPWAHVLARAQLFAQQPKEAEIYTQAIAALLWSVSERRAGSRKAEHEKLVSQLLPVLQSGLQSISMPQVQANSLLSDIKKLQETVQNAAAGAATDSSDSQAAPILSVN